MSRDHVYIYIFIYTHTHTYTYVYTQVVRRLLAWVWAPMVSVFTCLAQFVVPDRKFVTQPVFSCAPALSVPGESEARVKRDLRQSQKRPTTVSKETYYSVKRDQDRDTSHELANSSHKLRKMHNAAQALLHTQGRLSSCREDKRVRDTGPPPYSGSLVATI